MGDSPRGPDVVAEVDDELSGSDKEEGDDEEDANMHAECIRGACRITAPQAAGSCWRVP